MARPTKIGIPPGGTSGQVLIKSSSDDFDVEWGAGGTGGGTGEDAIPNGFLGRPYAVWNSLLIFDCYTPVYNINGVQYPTDAGQLTLDAADGTNPRIDVIAVDSTGLIKITGTASATPVKPTVDALTQLEITNISIAAGATTPTGIANENIYLENTEWTGSSNVTGANFADTTDPFAGTKDVSIGSFTNGQYVRFVDSVTNDISDYSHLKFYVKLKAQFLTNTGFIITFKNGTTVVSSAFTVTNGIYAFDRTDTSGYQLIAIPLSEFTMLSATFDTVNFELKGNNTSGFYFDNIMLQSGIVVITPGGGIVNSVVAGTNITVDNTDPANPVVSSTGSGSGTVNSGTQYRIAYYATTGTAVSEASAITAARVLISDANGVPTHSTVTSDELSQARVWVALPTMTRTDGDTFTIPDTGNAGNWDKKLDRLRVIKWTDTTTHMAIVKSSSYAANVVTVEIAGDTLDNTFTTTSGYYTTISATKVTFAIAGTMATGTDLGRKFYADCAYRVLLGKANHGTAGTTNATTYDVNKNGTTMFTTKLSVSSADTTGDDTTADNNTSLANEDYVTVDVDSISTTAPIDVYIDLYIFPTNNVFL